MARPLEGAALLNTYHLAGMSLFLFDYDGTLTPLIDNPAEAVLSPDMKSMIEILAASPTDDVWIISGRSKEFLEKLFGHSVGLSAEHGAFFRYPGNTKWMHLNGEKPDLSWQSDVVSHMKDNSMIAGSSVEEKDVAIVWHYRHVSDHDKGLLQAGKLKKELEDKAAENGWPVTVVMGHCIVEVRPTSVDKGEFVKKILDEMAQGKNSPDFVLCVGDDVTDEDMFHAVHASNLPSNGCFSVTVGGKSDKATFADWYLPDPEAVYTTLKMLTERPSP
ncbi:threalose-6-phosphate phosphatase [Mycoblastus sanguinarius]|nr:threalose-6-phosphate phosphatase [Mycoblastus sanguinarius]